ncbi:MAG TPA: hypothetical protein DCS93_44620 [Microscillaceae bacterium]|nr:hypothetical protein [Microscillaceae bacterium]
MKMIKQTFFTTLLTFSFFAQASAQSFNLPGDGNWYLVASMGGRHAFIEYVYNHATAHNPSIAKGEIHFINAKTYAIQRHQTMGYGAYNQPQFAVINFGNNTQLWVKATPGVSAGTFEILRYQYTTLHLGSTSDANLNDNGGNVKIYDKLPDSSHWLNGNVQVMDGKLGIGVSNFGSDNSFKLFVKGGIRAEKAKIDIASQNGWGDYVFEPTYKLPTLQEVETYLKAHKHLPGVPSAATLVKEGLDLGKMHKIQMVKIEELTLYTIQLKKENDALKQKMKKYESLAKRVEKLEKMLEKK